MSLGRKTRRAAAVVLACVLAALLAAGPASGASRDYKIYNLSSNPLRLLGAQPLGLPYVFEFEGRPLVGEVLMPGEPPHEWELKYLFLGDPSAARVVYDIMDGAAHRHTYTATMITSTLSNDSTCTIASEVGTCTAEGRTLTVADPPGTVHNVPADRAQEQADTLRQLCTETNAAKCGFTPREKRNTSTPARLADEPVFNCDTEDKVPTTFTATDKRGVEHSFGTKIGTELETNFIVGKVKASIEASYGAKWIEEHTFSQSVTMQVRPGNFGWVAVTSPVIRYTGDFTLRLGNTTWNLRNVYFDNPDKGNKAEFVVDQRAMSDEQRRTKCTGRPPGSAALSQAPASWVEMLRSGTSGDDVLEGARESNTLRGLAGDDLVLGGAGRGDDTLYGGRGGDNLNGARGRDRLRGGPGADRMVDNHGRTRVWTGADTGDGHDFVDVRDGQGDDVVRCHSARARAFADARDRLIGDCDRRAGA
jgi:hypothetical protein